MSSHKKDMCASIVAKLLGSGVQNTVVLSTIENLQEFVEDLQSDIQDQILNLIPASIILHNNQVVFVLIEHETFFHDHFHAFQVSEHMPRKILVIEREQLTHFKCFDAQMSYGCDSKFYIVLENCII